MTCSIWESNRTALSPRAPRLLSRKRLSTHTRLANVPEPRYDFDCRLGESRTKSMNRRMLMKWAAAAPVYGVIAARAMSDKLAGATGKTATIDVHRRLGVRPFLNARGTRTELGG